MAPPIDTAGINPAPAQTIGLADLAMLDAAEVARHNAGLAFLARRVFTLGGLPVRFERLVDTDVDDPAEPPALWLALALAGVPLLAGVSAAWAGALAQAEGVALAQLSPETLDLLCQLRLAPRLPTGLTLRQAAFERRALAAEAAETAEAAERPGLALAGHWAGRHLATGEASGHALQLWTPTGFALQALLQTLEPFVSGTLASPLAQLPIALPLVAARWQLPAAELIDLAVGDVLVLA